LVVAVMVDKEMLQLAQEAPIPEAVVVAEAIVQLAIF
jgi:hypothetical protein